MMSIGIDPGVHHTGVAVLDDDEEIVQLDVLREFKSGETALVNMSRRLCSHIQYIFKRYKCWDAVVTVERPDWYGRGDRSKPASIITLALVAGVALGASVMDPRARLKSMRLVTPRQWKGSWSKSKSHAQTRLLLSEVNRSLSLIPKSDHEHALDALGLALHGSRSARWREKVDAAVALIRTS